MSFVNKYFNRSKSLKVVCVGIDRKITTHYVIPENNTVVIKKGDIDGRYLFDPTKVFVGNKGIDKFKPIIFVVEGQAGAINPFDVNDTYPSELFEVAMSNNLVKDIVRATDVKTDKFGNIFNYIIIGLLVAVLFLLLKNGGSIVPDPIEAVISGRFIL